MDFFQSYQQAPSDPIFSLQERFKNDDSELKYNLSVGVYYDEKGSEFSMPVIKKAAELYLNNHFSTSYQPIRGNAIFLKALLHLIVGDQWKEKSEKNFAMIQTIGGTSALRCGADFLLRGGYKNIYVSEPTWNNHIGIFKEAGMEVAKYPYLESNTMSLDWNRLKNFVVNLKEKSVLLLHMCCHNPTGIDLNIKQWEELLVLIRKKKSLCFFDFAYLGLAQGIEEDCFPLRFSIESNFNCMVAFSCSKTFTLYGERVGALMVNAKNEAEKKIVQSQIQQIARRTYSNPPRFGADIVTIILNSKSLRKEWEENLLMIRKRIAQTRQYLAKKLVHIEPKSLLNSLKQGFGFFNLLGLEDDQVKYLYDQGIYLNRNSRINLAALNLNNIEYFINNFCKAIDK